MTKAIQEILILDHALNDSSIWMRSTISEANWLIPVKAACLKEILSWLDFIRKHQLSLLLRQPDQFDMPHCRALMERIRYVLES